MDPKLETLNHRLDFLIAELRRLADSHDRSQATLTRMWEITHEFSEGLDRSLTKMENDIYDAFKAATGPKAKRMS